MADEPTENLARKGITQLIRSRCREIGPVATSAALRCSEQMRFRVSGKSGTEEGHRTSPPIPRGRRCRGAAESGRCPQSSIGWNRSTGSGMLSIKRTETESDYTEARGPAAGSEGSKADNLLRVVVPGRLSSLIAAGKRGAQRGRGVEPRSNKRMSMVRSQARDSEGMQGRRE